MVLPLALLAHGIYAIVTQRATVYGEFGIIADLGTVIPRSAMGKG